MFYYYGKKCIYHFSTIGLTPESNATLLARSAKDVKLDSYE